MIGRERPVVAIDGPAGAGKSTVTRVVAERLGYHLINTGAIYRTVALAAQRAGFAFQEDEKVGALAHQLVAREAIQLVPDDGIEYRVLLEGEDVSKAIRTQVLGEGASKVSAIPAVRDALLELQRAAGRVHVHANWRLRHRWLVLRRRCTEPTELVPRMQSWSADHRLEQQGHGRQLL
jgi:cytidylate kinase